MFCPLNAICPSSTEYEFVTPCYGKYSGAYNDNNYFLLPYTSVKDSYPNPGLGANGVDQSENIEGLYLDDRRVQWARDRTTTCLDCNDYSTKAGMCQFTAGYFPQQGASRSMDNIINCPFQSLSRTVNKHKDYYYRVSSTPDADGKYGFVKL